MGSDTAFLALANTAIEAEIRAYFPYTALYRRLCRGGSERAIDYLYREFSPVLVDTADDGTPATAALVVGVAASSPGLSQTQRKRRRASLVEELQQSLKEFAAGTARLVQARLEAAAPSGKESEVCDSAAVTVPPTTGGAGAEPYTVTCRRCTTNVTCAYPCWVLDGYVVLWAESVLEVECVATKAAVAASLLASPVVAAHTQGNSSVKGSLALRRPRDAIDSRAFQAANTLHFSSRRLLFSSHRPLGLRPLLQRLTGALDGSAEDATAPPAPLMATTRAKETRSRKQRGRSHSDSTHPCASTGPPPPATRMLRLHSMSIVNSDAVSNMRPASFALQSVVQPGWQTALECYPRHMVHFGLLVYAAWHASSRTWESVLSHGGTCRDGSAAAENGHTVMLPSRSSRSDAALQNTSGERGAWHTPESTTEPTSLSPTPEVGGEMRPASLVKLLPHTSHDAVLILGLGGNVLGQCLDALLPAAVPLHIVEVEPAVLQACCEHGQFPAIDVVDDWRGERDAAPSCNALKRASAPHKKDVSPCRSEEMLETAPAASLVCPAAMQWAAGLIHCKSATPAAFRAMRQQAPMLLERLAAPPSAVPSSATKRATCAPSLPRGSGTAVEAPLQAQQDRGEYVCFLQDAYAYLRTSASSPTTLTAAQGAVARHRASHSANGAAHPVAPSSPPQETCPRLSAQSRTLSSKQEKESSSAVEDATPLLQYSMIFLDCYDPDRERMMHEGTLVELCARRLRPGGVLVVNAHVLPSVENLRRDFLGCGFSTVQALRVAGHTQTVVVCVAQDKVADGAPAATERLASRAACAPMLTEKRGRFTVRQMQLLATALNGYLHVAGSSSSSVTGGGDAAGRDKVSPAAATSTTADASSLSCTSPPSPPVMPAFWFDAAWLKSCRRVVVPPTKMPSGCRARPASTTPSQACSIDVDLRVWEHYF
ncbi:conserved hypothetical protein [Leishmania major strain Friedlin]|uniref:Uncharacterized protein n=1 Tax=Leishmania major TaxID=5664 RepID=Q4Q891_LEIMA|nr:conserved hypothetical protein [Leishmania major strain Friedlin]CAG9577285.1 hypothetical_protein_-_conserved [Leishmania major strain Friedlin]CAJ05535.1 conserved hypothetical protein [Leishmania major strain Friedlin]|eukprot:XP_001684457.1 conserved hypothetical protein [Leishmania major strain Friedlin]